MPERPVAQLSGRGHGWVINSTTGLPQSVPTKSSGVGFALKTVRKKSNGYNCSVLFRAKRVTARHLSRLQSCGEPARALR
jgi:hypothetical protein